MSNIFSPAEQLPETRGRTIRTRWIIFMALLLCLLLIAAIYVRAFWHVPNPTVDYLAIANANALAVAEEDRAWPLYRQVILDYYLDQGDSAIPGWGPKPDREYTPPATQDAAGEQAIRYLSELDRIPVDDPRWPEAHTQIQKNAAMFEAIRQAAQKKHRVLGS